MASISYVTTVSAATQLSLMPPTRAAILAAILIDFVSYFVLTYLALWLLARRQPALPQVIELKYEREA